MAISTIKPIAHGDFTFDDEKIEEIAKSIEVVNKKEAFLGQFFSPTAEINGDQMIKRRQVLLDPDSLADLNEGDTPREDSIKVVSYSEKTRSFGSFIPYTRHAVKRNRDNVVEMSRRQLSHARLYDVENLRFLALVSTTYSADATYADSKFNWWDTLTNLSIRLDKNGGKGEKIFLCTPEIKRDIAREMKEANSLLQGTEEGAKLIRMGYAGDYCDFHIISCANKYMYRDISGTRYHMAFAFCKGEGGLWPMVDTGMGRDAQGEVIIKNLGELGNDPTNEIGSIASRLDYVGAFVEHPELLIRIANVTAGSGGRLAEVGADVPGAYKIEANVSTGVGAGRDNATYQKVVSGGAKFKLEVAVVAASDGTAITSPTVAIKVGSSSGTAVTADANGKYELVPGAVYYYSVSKTSYTTQTGTFVADPSEKKITFKLVAA